MDEDAASDSTNLFDSVLGGLSEDQWEQYKLQKKLEGGFVVNHDEEESERQSDPDASFLDNSRPDSPCYFADDLITKIDVIEERSKASSVSSEGGEEEDEDEEVCVGNNHKEWTGDAAMKYVNGDIDFNSLADIMENAYKESETWGRENEEGTAKKQRKPRRRLCELPKELVGLMGSATASFVERDYDTAIAKCLKMVRSAPFAQEPYQTLSIIYDEMGDTKKSLQCALAAAYLNPTDTAEWIRLANLAIEQSQLPQAVKCLSLAIRNEPNNVDLLWQRCNLYEQLEDRKNALAGYELILKNLTNEEDGEQCLQLARDIAKIHHSNEDATNAIRILETAFTRFPDLVTSEDINMLLEHLMNEKMYKTALKNIVFHCGVTVFIGKHIIDAKNASELESDEPSTIDKCDFPSILHIDLMVKLLVCLIYLKSLKATKEMMTRLTSESPEDMGDLYLDVAEALMEVKEYSAAKPLLSALVSSHKFNAAGVWLRYADCLNSLSENSEATDAYERVLRLAPTYQEARIPLSKLLINSGDKKAAADALRQEYEIENKDADVDLTVLVQRADILYDLGCYEDFISAAKLTLLSHCIPVKTFDEINLVINNGTYRRRRELLKELPSITNLEFPTFINCDTPMEKLFDIFYKLCRILFEFQRFSELQDVTLMGMTSDVFRKSLKVSKDVDFLGLLACHFNENHKLAYSLIKDFILKDMKSNKAFNLFSLNIIKNQHVRHQRFCLRLMTKHTTHVALGLFNGQSAMISGSYKLALGEYGSLLHKMPNDPLMNFFVGITFIHMASQKFATKRHFLIAQGMAFLQKYNKLRKDSQESLFNIGRAYHQLGIKDAAVFYYKKALETPPALVDPRNEELHDLTREIAFNLALIYQSCEQYKLASMYLRTYYVI